MALQVDTVFVWVTDIDSSLDWYQAIGFTPGPRYGPWQSIDVDGDTQFALHQGIRDPGMSTSVPSFRVTDLEAELARLCQLDIQPTDAGITDTGTGRFTTFTDPDDNEIQLVERY